MLRRIVYPSVVVLLPFLMYIQLWHGGASERTFIPGDIEDSYYPDLRVIERALFEGQFPLWNPYDRGGYPFAADPQPGVLYPLNWLLAVVGHLQGGVSLGLAHFKSLLHLAIAGLSMYLFMRGREQPRPAAAVAGVSYQFGAYFTPQAVFSLVWPLAWTPLLMLSLDRLFARPTPRAAVAVALCMGLITNAGSPPSVFYGALITAPYVCLRLVESLRGVRFKAWAASTGLQLVFAGGLGTILSLPQLIATMVLTKHSVLERPSFDHAGSGSLIPEQLLGLAVQSLGDHFYVGICALFLACLGALYARERREVGVFLAVIVLGLFLMMGVNTQLFRVAYDLVPGIDRFRLCFRYVALVSFGISVLASFGVTALLERAVSERALRFFGGCALVLMVLALLLSSMKLEAVRDPWIIRDVTTIGILLGLSVVIAHGISRHASNHAALAACLLGLVSLDYSMFIPRLGAQRLAAGHSPDLLTAEERETLRHDVRGYRVFNAFALDTFRGGSVEGFRDLSGYIDPLVLKPFTAVMFEQLKFHPAKVMALFNVKYYLFSPHHHFGTSRHFVPDPQATPGFTRIKPNLYEVADPSPNAYWVGQVELGLDNAEVLAKLSTVNHHKSALMALDELDEAQRTWALGLRTPARDAVAARVLARGNNYVTFSVDAPADGLLVMNEAWFPGWIAEVDGNSAPLVHVNSMMQGVRLTPGQHRVELRFRPYYFLVPLALAVLSLLAVALGFAVHARRNGLLSFTRAA